MKTITVNDFGIREGEDITEALFSLFESNKTDTEFVFRKGTYFFSPKFEHPYSLSNTDFIETHKLGIWMKGMKNVRIDFGGSRLLFSGHMNGITCDRCEDIKIENAVIDWPEPFVAEGIIRRITGKHVDLYIDSKKYPHTFVPKNGLKFHYGNGEANYLWAFRQYEKSSRTITRYDSGSVNFFSNVEYLGGDVYRFEAKNFKGDVGNICVLRHSLRNNAGIFMEKCTGVELTDITFHSTSGIGCLAQFCDTLSFRRIHYTPNKEAGRIISGGRDDGIHITSCKGKITISECSFFGLMDDPINIHGCSVIAEAVIDKKTLRCRYGHDESKNFSYWAEAGDEISFIDRKHMNRISLNKSVSFVPEDAYHFVISFENEMDDDIIGMISDPAAVALENITNTSEVVVKSNRFGSGQGRGMLVSTPKPVLIKDNIFMSSGSAILIPGDANYWFESGECHDVEITGNVFSDTCLSTVFQYCEGIISICPVIPEPDTSKPFHKNINIHDNYFDTPDAPVLYALSCEGLFFTGNSIYHSPSQDSKFVGSALVRLYNCRNSKVSGNRYIGQFGLSDFEITDCEAITAER